MYNYYNPHPKGLQTDDCVKRAIVVVTGMDYMAVQRELNAFKKVTGAKKFNSLQNLCYVEDVWQAKKIIPEGRTTAGEFCRKHPNGRYILSIASHWSSCVEGMIYDTWDCSNELVLAAYQVEATPYTPPDLSKQIFKYCCTSERISRRETRVRIYDGNGVFTERVIPTELTAGYIRCLQDSNYRHIDLLGGSKNAG